MSVSTAFREITYTEALAQPYSDAWLDTSIPPKQLALVRIEINSWLNGKPMPLFDTLTSCLDTISTITPEVLEIGCGVGHNAFVIDHYGTANYIGIDYNPECIRLAIAESWSKRCAFELMDALKPTYPSNHFDVVITSACLLHILDWRTALSEAARLSRRYLVLHRTPISRSNKPRYFIKSGYGVEMFEQWFTEYDLFEKITALGFKLNRVWTTSADDQHAYKTYLLERRKADELAHHPV